MRLRVGRRELPVVQVAGALEPAEDIVNVRHEFGPPPQFVAQFRYGVRPAAERPQGVLPQGNRRQFSGLSPIHTELPYVSMR